ncbi:protein kinase family protein [Bacillus velezensis]|uniref:kinase n=1 Tax=Bacillus velezensis TaxID=492670 RepID=UPI000F42BACE|nr:kinase [Bacillus velezensis]AYV17662.1 kinase [Bacillus velezensis]
MKNPPIRRVFFMSADGAAQENDEIVSFPIATRLHIILHHNEGCVGMKRFFSETYFNNPENKKALEDYPLIGDGKDGEVYRLTHNKCIKYFFEKGTCKKELAALKTGQGSPVIPRLYEYGDRYIVMEYVQGTSLARHIRKEKSLSVKLTADILNMLDELKRIGFTRWDAEIRHILINEHGNLKVIDHKRAFSTVTRVPVKLLKGLDKYGLTDEFLNTIKKLNPSRYREWRREL